MTIPPPQPLSSAISWKSSLLFITTALVEFYLLSVFCGSFGLTCTVAFVLLSMVLGFSIMRWEGARCWTRIISSAQSGQSATEEMKNGVLIIFGGILMIFPGILTDIIGLLLFFPPTRAIIRILFFRKMFFNVPQGANSPFQFYQFGTFSDASNSDESGYCQNGATQPPGVQIIDVEVKKPEEESPDEVKK